MQFAKSIPTLQIHFYFQAILDFYFTNHQKFHHIRNLALQDTTRFIGIIEYPYFEAQKFDPN